jgi:hypothetical protein
MLEASPHNTDQTSGGISETVMTVIYPDLYLMLERFPKHKESLRLLYRDSESFRLICQEYRKCLEAVRYWASIENPEALDRHREYKMLLQELELEIVNSLTELP